MNDYPSMLSPFQERRRSPAALSSAMESPRLLECALARGDGITCDRTSFAEVRESVDVQMLWGERRGHGTIGAIQWLPMELPHVATSSF
jgi:hypothetical protein